MTEIKRYESGHDELEDCVFDGCRIRENGPLVAYEDLAAIVAEKDARIAELESTNKSVTEHYLRVTAERNEALYKVIELQQQVRALAAEADRMKNAINQVFPFGVDDEKGKIGFSGIAKECYASALETPATDSVLREIRAQAVEEYAITVGAEKNGAIYAASIRAGEKS
ncbi:MAG: hypothetical protein [Bacteriophage sp.]|nr:MAG: hypothetical protein [Bacteriophage sp.]